MGVFEVGAWATVGRQGLEPAVGFQRRYRELRMPVVIMAGTRRSMRL